MSLFLVSYPTPPTASWYVDISGERHEGRVGGQGSLTGGSDNCVSVSAEWACSYPKCGLSDFPEPLGECVQGLLKVKGTTG